jgi:deoxyribonuclease V
MIACVDVFYQPERANAACLLFRDWPADTAVEEVALELPAGEPYRSGQLFRRELPSILAVLEALSQAPAVVLIDGYVWLDAAGTPGLGGHLYRALGEATSVVGVAKTQFRGAPAVAVTRGHSRVPLYVSAAGIDPAEAAANVRRMHGAFRIPTLLKRVDRLCRTRGGGT